MLKALQRTIQAIENAHDFDNALRVIVEYTKEALDTCACALFLTDRRNNCYILAATAGLAFSGIGSVKIESSKGLIGVVAEKEAPVNVVNPEQHPRFLSMPSVEEENSMRFLVYLLFIIVNCWVF